MTDQVLDNGTLRDATPEEQAEIDARRAAASTPVVPDRIPMLNAQLTMIYAGWMDSVNACIDALPEPDKSKAQVYMAQALTMERTHPLVVSIIAAIGKTDAEVDQLFITAAALQV